MKNRVKTKHYICLGLSVIFFSIIVYEPLSIQFLRVFINPKNLDNINDKVALSSNGCFVENILIYNSIYDSLHIKDRMTGESKLIVNFLNCNCSPCLDNILMYTEKYKTKIGEENIIIVGNFQSATIFSRFIHYNSIPFEVYNMAEKSFNLPADTLHLPYFMWMDSSMICSGTFIPIRTIPSRTDEYFNEILIDDF